MAQKSGRQAVWLNLGAPTKLISIEIEYDQSGGQILSGAPLTTQFLKGQFEISLPHSLPGEHFRTLQDPIYGSYIHYEISAKTVKYYFRYEGIKAFKIEDSVRDLLSLTVTFTDYLKTATVRPKMSQPGTS